MGVKLKNLDDYQYLNWVQTVYSNTVKAAMGIGGHSDGFKPTFRDSPNRNITERFTFWHAELSLVGVRNGKIEIIFPFL